MTSRKPTRILGLIALLALAAAAGVAVDGSYNVYVADAYNNRIQKFKPVR